MVEIDGGRIFDGPRATDYTAAPMVEAVRHTTNSCSLASDRTTATWRKLLTKQETLRYR